MDDLVAASDAAVADAPPVPDEGGSLSDHEAAFSPEAQQAPATDEPPASAPADRDERGKFKPRHRAKSQQAGAGDVPRIAELTKNWRTAESERDAVKAERDAARAEVEAARRERDELKARHDKPAEPAPKPAAVIDPKDPRPTEADFEDYGEFIEARAAWKYRQIQREDKATTQFREWAGRRDAFVAKNPTRAQALGEFLVTLETGTPIGDAIIESEVGAELADYLAANPAEAERIGTLSPVSQIRALGRIEAAFLDSTPVASQQRSSASLRSAAVSTGSAPALVRPPAPRPPNPVRTGSIAEPDTPPDPDDQSLSAHEKYYGGRSRR